MKKERESLAGETLRVHMTRATSLQENLRQNETKSQGSSKSPKLQGHSGKNMLTISLGIIQISDNNPGLLKEDNTDPLGS